MAPTASGRRTRRVAPATPTPPTGATPGEYRATLDRLFALRRFGMRPGLETMEALLEARGHPEATFPAIHVAGSKGKGSVTAMAASILRSAGRRVGRYTSPHLTSYRERIEVDGEPIAPGEVVAGVAAIEATFAELAAAGKLPQAPTFFELTTVLAFEEFRSRGVEAAVVEVGLGGRLDATNVVRAPVGVITTIELEHTEILGPTLTDIAREKAGILKPGMRAILGEGKEEPRREIERVASSVGVPLERFGSGLAVEERSIDPKGQVFRLVTPRRRLERVRIPLQGAHQATNAALAVAAVETLARHEGWTISDGAIRRGLAAVRWPGRLQVIGHRPTVFADVAHTPESARAVAQAIAEIEPFTDPAENVLLFGCLSDKNVEEILEAVEPLATTLVATRVRSDRARAPEEIRRSAIGRFARIVIVDDAAQGLALARAAAGTDGFVLVFGSDYLVGELLPRDTAPAEPDLSDPVATAKPPRSRA